MTKFKEIEFNYRSFDRWAFTIMVKNKADILQLYIDA